MRFFLLLTFISITCAQKSTHDSYYCYSRDPIRSQRRLFGIPGHYDDVRGNALGNPMSTCTPSKLWFFARGGTRIPGAPHLQRMTEASKEVHLNLMEAIDAGRSQFCRPDADALLEWRFNTSITPDRAFTLMQTGWNEMRDLALRLQREFPQILPTSYNQNQFRFRHTTAQRTFENLQAISDGLFGHSNVIFDDIPTHDRLLWPTSSCRLYDEWMDNVHELNGFREGSDFRQMVEAVNRKLGLSGPKQLTIDQLEGITDVCRFEHSWNPSGDSKWCAALSISNQEVMDFATDLLTYHTTGYGGDERLFSNLHCHAMQDLLNFIQSDDENDHLARFHVTHQEVFRLLFISLGVFRDRTPLHRQNYSHQTPRLWKTSLISSHASNIIFIKHNCADGDNDVVIMQNENPLDIPGCERPGLCKQETLLRIFSRFLTANCETLYCSRD